ncbi:MAG: hypothetical protein [Inoviridae sp.]|nr:MAG: hypothetical protein [Inoviridae sp.]
MTEKKKSFFKNSPFKLLISLLMAFTMFFSVPFVSRADKVSGGMSISIPWVNEIIPLTFFGNYTVDGSDRDSDIPYTFRGSVTLPITFSRSNGSVYYEFVSGNAYLDITYTTPTQVAGKKSSFISASLASTSLPQGVSASVRCVDRSQTSAKYRIELSFTRAELILPAKGSITLDLSYMMYAPAHDFGSSYYYLGVNTSGASDFVDNGLNFFNSLNGYSNDVTFIRNRLQSIDDEAMTTNSILSTIQSLDTTRNSTLSNIYSRQNTINSNITTQSTNIRNKIQSQMDNDNANTTAINNKIQAQIDNDNANHKQIMDNWAAWEVITGDREDNHLANDNKNADDIMHSYDSGSQEDKNSEFDASQKQLQETEDNLFGSASGYFSGLDFSLFDIAKFTSVVSSLSFVSGLMQSLFQKMGDFGLIVTVGMVIMIASKVIGVYRFSTGDHGKGG